MLKELKKQSFKKVLPVSIIAILIGVVLIYATDFGIFKLIGGGKLLDDLPRDQILGKYVSYRVDLLYDSYAYTTETSDSSPQERIISSEYIIPVGYENGYYMGLYADESLIYKLDSLLDSSLSYLNGEIDSPGMYYDVKGTVMPMDDESLSFFKETVGYEEGDAEYQEMFRPYYLKVNYLGRLDTSTTVFMTILGALFLLYGFYSPVRALAGGYQNKVKKFCKLSGEGVWNQLESWYQYVPCINSVRINERWTMFNRGAHTYILNTSDIVWAYYKVTTHRTNGIKTGTTYGLILCTDNRKKRYEITMHTQDEAQEVLDYIGNHFPNIILGYDEEREGKYKKDPAGFARTELAMMESERDFTI